MKTPAILYLWFASFAADNLWRIVLPLTDRATARVSYAVAWGVLAAVLILIARLGAFRAAFTLLIATWAATDALNGRVEVYTYGLTVVRILAFIACLGIVALATTRYAFAAAVGLAAGHALALGSFLISRVGPILLPDAGSQLAMRYGPWASTVEGLGCVLVMALALTWASRPGATAR